MEQSSLKIGDPVKVPNYNNGTWYLGYVVEHNRYGLQDTVCVFINWDGDGVYTDWNPKYVEPSTMSELLPSMRVSALELRRKEYMKQ